jgi:ketosteroid isomerase-like protein
MTTAANRTESNLELARRYLATMESGSADAKLAFFAPDVIQEEFPNRITPTTRSRDLAGLRDGIEKGSSIMASERYEILNAVAGADSDQVALEVQWSGTLATGLGPLPAGAVMRARLAIFLEFREGKIVRQRNYDCYEPW